MLWQKKKKWKKITTKKILQMKNPEEEVHLTNKEKNKLIKKNVNKCVNKS